MKKIIAFLLVLFSLTSFSQRKYKKEFSFSNDNDLYISLSQDRYYTNGMFFTYRFLSNLSNKKVEKKIYELQIGHRMYTPFKATVQTRGQQDRPFASYLFGAFGINYFFKKSSILKNSLEIGIIGPAALGRELQDFIHDIYGFRKAIGWKYQIKNAFALNFNTSFTKPLLKNKSKYYDLNWTNKATLGTVFTNISSGFYGRIGLKPLQNLVNSIAFNSNLNNNNSKFNNEIESFIYIRPMVNYILYDATIQGSFLNKNSPITYPVTPIVFSTEIGIRFTANRFNLGYTVHYHTKKLKSIQVPQGNFYGNIQINYQFN
ncbi:lipid A deacylase LpxR family protein [Tenacibaculum sp. nBUS_03]|uniref:lipid A deacylase LpxR family protein n=1 Tax=Tenacibaculum sp. nBUS_03 TaxID=3395320 RepID=UPI003EBE580E